MTRIRTTQEHVREVVAAIKEYTDKTTIKNVDIILKTDAQNLRKYYLSEMTGRRIGFILEELEQRGFLTKYSFSCQKLNQYEIPPLWKGKKEEVFTKIMTIFEFDKR